MTAAQKGRIFISYRRADSAGYAGRIYDRLSTHFGEDAVFMDVDDIGAGLDFVNVLENAVQSCDVVIALIGTRWLNIKDSAGKRRLDNPEDFVRIEIAAALKRKIHVIPVLFDDVEMPHKTKLPYGLKKLAGRNAVPVHHHSFNSDAYRLISQLKSALEAAEKLKILKERKIAITIARTREKEERKTIEKTTREQAKHEVTEKIIKEKAKQGTSKASKTKYIVGIIFLFFIIIYLAEFLFTASENPMPTKFPLTETFAPTTISPSITFVPTVEINFVFGIGSTMISPIDSMTLLYVPSGEFEMGYDANYALKECAKFIAGCEKEWFLDAEPIHTVNVGSYWIDQTEITNRMFSSFLNNQANVEETWIDLESEIRIHKDGDI